MLRNTRHHWGSIAKFLHWLIALAIFTQFALGWTAADLPVSPRKIDLFVWHKSIGVSILFLVVLRIAWRSMNARPETADGIAPWERRLAQAGHLLLYVLMVVVPLTGWWVSDTSRIPFRLFRVVPVPDMMQADRAGSDLAAAVHGALKTLLIIVIAMHVLAALRHHFILRNVTLERMLPWR